MSNKNIFVFGGTGSIGKALSIKLKHDNYDPIIISRNETELKQLSEEIGCEYKVCDVLDFDKVKSISEEYKDRLSGIAFCVGSINLKPLKMTKDEDKLFGIEKLNLSRSTIPAVTHVNYTARVQTVSEKTNPRYYKLIHAFKQKTGCPTIVNTSFNVRGEPIVCTPQDAYRCFMRTEMDILVLQNQILYKSAQPRVEKDETWKQEFELD